MEMGTPNACLRLSVARCVLVDDVLLPWVAWIVLLFRVIADIFRNDSIGGFSKALWLIFVIVVPWLGVLIYLMANGGDMGRRSVAQQQASQDAADSYIREAAGSGGGSSADELTKLAALRDSGVLTDDEFAAQKGKLLA
jgi:hypothetical protein